MTPARIRFLADAARKAAMLVATSLVMGAAAGSGLEDLVARTKASVVAVGTFQALRNPQFAFRGTGFVVGDGSLVVTNAHVLPSVVDGAGAKETLAVVLQSGRSGSVEHRTVRLVASDPDHDLAILRLAGAALVPLRLAADGSVREGQAVAFMGFPIGSVLGLTPVTHRALVSAITPIAIPTDAAIQLDERRIRRLKSGPFEVYQLDGTAYPGNSGGPLLDAGTGEVVGIVNMVLVKATRESLLSQPSGISFAIPARHLRELLGRVAPDR